MSESQIHKQNEKNNRYTINFDLLSDVKTEKKYIDQKRG
jgi:hypothetical protein